MKTNFLLEAKLNNPRPVREFIRREGLMEAIGGCKERMVIFHANMGFGKTMVMNEFAMESGLPYLWYHLDRHDNEVPVFLQYLETAALSFSDRGEAALEERNRKEPGLSGGEEKLAESGLRGKEVRPAESGLRGEEVRPAEPRLYGEEDHPAERIASLLDVPGGRILMLDDFQEIENPKIEEILDGILRNTSPSVRLFITTKGALPSFVTRYLLSGDAVVFTNGELAFSREETYRLLQVGSARGTEPEIADAVYEYTEGWPAGVMFLYLYRKQGRIVAGRDQMLKICQEFLVHDYIMYELFRKLPFDVQNFLKRTSVLEYLDSSICNAVANVKNASGQLKYLVQENMFVQTMEGDAGSYRYHSMFRDFLKSQLTEEEREEVYSRAARYCLGKGQFQQAVEYALGAEKVELVVSLLETCGFGLLKEGCFRILSDSIQWIRARGGKLSPSVQALEQFLKLETGELALSAAGFLGVLEEIRETSPDEGLYERLVSMAAEFFYRKGRLDETERILAEAEKQEKAPSLFGVELLAARVYLNFRMGAVERAERLGGRLMKLQPERLRVAPKARERMAALKRRVANLLAVWLGREERLLPVTKDSWWLWPEAAPGLAERIGDYRTLLAALLKDGERPEAKVLLRVEQEPGGDWLSAANRVLGGLALFEAGEKKRGLSLLTEGFETLPERCFFLPEEIFKRSVRLNLLARDLKEGKGQDAPCHIFVACFGSFSMRVLETGEEIRFRTAKARECMAYLFHVGKPVSRETLLEVLWRNLDGLPGNEVAALHNLLSSIRKSLAPFGMEGLLQYENKRYSLRADWLFSFREELERVVRGADLGEGERILDQYGVCSQYEGPYLYDVGGAWCEDSRAYYERTMYECFYSLGRRLRENEEYGRGLAFLKRAERMEPGTEKVNLEIMDCLAGEGNGKELARWFGEMKKTFREMSGEEPGKRLLEAYSRCMELCREKG